jgi:hypothetical protein
MRMINLLKQIGQPSKCKACNMQIAFVKHLNGKIVPYDYEQPTLGSNHFITCPKGQRIRSAGFCWQS